MYVSGKYPLLLLGLHTYSLRAFCFGRRICRLSVLHQISYTKQDRHEILSPLWEIGVAEQEYDIKFCTGISWIPQK